MANRQHAAMGLELQNAFLGRMPYRLPPPRPQDLAVGAAHPVVAAVIPGPRTASEVMLNADLMSAEIPGQLWRDLQSAGLLPEAAPTPD